MIKNPWKSSGVSLVPEELSEWTPLVGQKELYKKLLAYKNEALSLTKDKLAGFFVLVGGWGLGKSKIGHETCLEAVDPDIEWIIDGHGHRIIEPGLKEGLLPLFIRYSQVTEGPFPIATESWIPAAVYQALIRLIQQPEETGSSLKRNQTRLYEHIRALLQPKGFSSIKGDLEAALAVASNNPESIKHIQRGIRQALDVLKTIGIEQLWIVVDEIEDITDVKRDGLEDEDRKGIEHAYLTVIGGVIKQEEIRQDYPDVNFLLLCSRAVGDFIRDIKALERRTGFWELQSNSFIDVEACFQYLKKNRPDLYAEMERYPEGLKEAAFFAANRNFGWFNVIMYYCHNNFRGGSVPVPELLRMFAEDDSRASRSVFDLGAISDFNIPAGPHKPEMVELIFGQLPKRIGPGGITRELAETLLTARHCGSDQNLFAPLVEVFTPPEHEIMQYMVRSGFRNEAGNILSLPGEARFDLGEVLASLRSYSLGLPEDSRDHLLIFTSLDEFVEQIRGLTPYDQQAQLIAGPLHKLLIQEGYRIKENGVDKQYIAPSFSFMLRFNLLNKRTRAETGYLKDGAKNSALEEEYKRVANNAKKRAALLLRGIAQAWEDAVVEGFCDNELNCLNLIFSSLREPLNIGAAGQVTLLYASGVDQGKLQLDLTRVARKPVHPVIIVLEGRVEKEEELAKWVTHETKDSIAPFIIVRHFSNYQSEILIRFGMMGTVFSANELRTSYFNSGIALVRQHLYQILESQDNSWRKRLEKEGLILRPIYFKKNVSSEDLQLLAKGYSLALGGKSFTALLQDSEPALTADEKEDFKRLVKNHTQIPARYEGLNALGLFIEENGNYLAQIPRSLIALLKKFKDFSFTVADLEPKFLYDAGDLRPAEVVRQAVGFLEALGFLTPEGNGKYRRISVKTLKDMLETASTWLTNPDGFAKQAMAIKAVSEQLGVNLTEVYAKEAKAKIKEASGLLACLDLQFFSWDNTKLEERVENSNDFMYQHLFKKAVNKISAIRNAISQVYDTEEARTFTYTPDLLQVFEVESNHSCYPLWKRLYILHGFCSQLVSKRTVLTQMIREKIQESDRRVPEGNDGQKIFPTQVLSIPLKQWEQELNFPAASPHTSISGGFSTALPHTLGFKVAQGKYHEAWKRLIELEAELTAPDRLPARYFTCLEQWEELCRQLKNVEKILEKWIKFFADASDLVREKFGLPGLIKEIDLLSEQILNGGMRTGTDEREGARATAQQLIEGLEQDLNQVKGGPGKAEQNLSVLRSSILQSLEQEYQDKYKDVLSAYNRILLAQHKDLRTFPGSLSATYGQTVAAFEAVIANAGIEGKEFFTDQTSVSWQDFVALCGMDLEGQEIPWDTPPYSSFVPVLQREGLLKLKLI